MGMFDNDTITDEFFTSDAEQVKEELAESEQEELEENEELDTNEHVDSDEDTSTTEQVESTLLAGKFKSQDDLVNAYKNLEREFTKSRQTKQTTTTQEQTTQQTQQSQGDPNELFWTNFQQDPLGMLSYLVNESVSQITKPIHEKEAYQTLGKDIDSLAKEYKQIQSEEGLSNLFNKAQEIASSLGNEQMARNPRILKMAAIEAFGDSKAEVYKKAKEEGKKEADEVRRTKQEMSTVTSSKKPVEKAKTQEDLITDAILSFNTKSIFSGR